MKNAKGISIWQLKTIGGALKPIEYCAEKAADLCAGAGFDRVDIKAADGVTPYRANALTPKVIDIFHRRGIAVWGWSFLYGAQPVIEGQIAGQAVLTAGLDGYFMDAESRFEGQPTAEGNAVALMRAYRALCPDTLTACCGWAAFYSPSGGTWHKIAPYRAFMNPGGNVRGCDYGMPMCYHGGNTVSAAEANLREAVKQWHLFTDKPLIPECRAYRGDSGEATPSTILASGEWTRNSSACAGIGWWGLDWAMKQQPWMDALYATRNWTTAPPHPAEPQDPLVAFLALGETARWQAVGKHLAAAEEI